MSAHTLSAGGSALVALAEVQCSLSEKTTHDKMGAEICDYVSRLSPIKQDDKSPYAVADLGRLTKELIDSGQMDAGRADLISNVFDFLTGHEQLITHKK